MMARLPTDKQKELTDPRSVSSFAFVFDLPPARLCAQQGGCPRVDAQIFPKGWYHGADYEKERIEFTLSGWNDDEGLEKKLKQLREYVEGLEKKEEEE